MDNSIPPAASTGLLALKPVSHLGHTLLSRAVAGSGSKDLVAHLFSSLQVCVSYADLLQWCGCELVCASLLVWSPVLKAAVPTRWAMGK